VIFSGFSQFIFDGGVAEGVRGDRLLGRRKGKPKKIRNRLPWLNGQGAVFFIDKIVTFGYNRL